MQPVVFETLPAVFSFVAVFILVDICVLLLATGRRFLRPAAYVAVGVSGSVIGERLALFVFAPGAWVGIAAGAVAGIALCKMLRPVAVGVVLAFLGYYGATYLVSLQYVQYVAALVMFAYGLLLTDLAPTFVSNLLASSILLLTGIWLGVPIPSLIALITLTAAARLIVTLVPSWLRLITKAYLT